uniref:Polyadenylate-binding protein-interacting protein 1 n=1 Tax=Oncorhynchus kisutch TaxID=8019 RepID=A0A8C7N3Q5_ONCKI
MTENFDRAPGAGRAHIKPRSPGLADVGDGDATSVFNQREPLRQPRTSPPLTENNPNNSEAIGEESRIPSKPHQFIHSHSTPASKVKSVDSPVNTSILSANAPEFYPASFSPYEESVSEDGSDGYYTEMTLAELVEEFLSYLNSSPGSFETDIEHMVNMLNSWVTTEETLQELVELIYTQSTAIPNFAYTGARLCNFLSHNLVLSPASGNFRQLLLKRCRTEYEQRDVAVRGDQETQKKFQAYVLFLGELYLRLEVKSAKGPPSRAEILLIALRELMNALFSNPVDGNLICAVKLLKLTGSVLEDVWKEKGKSDMDQLVQRIENIVLDAQCSRMSLRSTLQTALPSQQPTLVSISTLFIKVKPCKSFALSLKVCFCVTEYSEKYQDILDREDDCFPEDCEENGNESSFNDEDEMDPEIEEAFEKFCLESERRRR